MSAEGEGLSKSARKRANQKARAAGEAAEAEPPAPAPKAKAPAAPKAEAASKAKAKAKAEAAPPPEPEPKAKAKGKAKAEPKAAAAPEPAPKAESKAKAKAKGEAKAAPAPAPAPAEGQAKAKSKAKAKAKKEEPQAPPKVEEDVGRFTLDDGTGGEWEVASAVSKKQQKRQESIAEKKKQEEEEKKAAEIAAKQAEKAAKAAAKSQAKAKPDAKAKPAAKAETKATSAPAVAVVSAAAVDAKEKQEDQKPTEPDPNVTVSVKVPSEKIGRVIGPKGSNIALIKEKTGIKSLDTAVDVVTIIGLPENVGPAEIAIHELIEKGYMSLAFEDFKQDEVAVLPNSIPNIIGERGAIIQVIKKECKVEIDIPPVPKNAPANRKVKVTVAGGAEGVEKAKEVINSIAVHQHHEVTHPGFTHQEMEVEEHKYRFIIGKGGSEMRHIQNNFKVKVNIPREGSISDKVLVVGEDRDVERAVQYIEKILSNADEPRGRAAPEKSDDPWGAEEPEEAWMNPYMYKRR
jgi:predicted RNA-binding protein YlqC (UPF0109 family)